MTAPLPFEEPFVQLEERIKELRLTASSNDLELSKELKRLEVKSIEVLGKAYENLSPLQVLSVARHPERPQGTDYIKHLIQDFIPLAGDRIFGEDKAILAGLGRFRNRPVMALAQVKGKTTEERLACNFGMARPEGYRKAKRLIELAGRFHLPIISFVDTAGAHPDVDAEERGQSQAIAECIEASLTAPVPVLSVIIGEGGSGGAVALASGNAVLMLAYSVYSVISPESCAAILWRTSEKTDMAAEALKMTAPHLKKLGIIDDVIPEPPGGAHRNSLSVIHAAGDALEKSLTDLPKDPEKIIAHRHQRFEALGRSGVRL